MGLRFFSQPAVKDEKKEEDELKKKWEALETAEMIDEDDEEEAMKKGLPHQYR